MTNNVSFCVHKAIIFFESGDLFTVQIMLNLLHTISYSFESICFQLGVNGYSFIINNNGHILYHPDLRPLVSLNFIFIIIKWTE